jgi:hypothetical protein
MPYTPGITFWSDGAEKHRFLSLPAGTQIDTSNLDAWNFPVGTKAWKEFRVGGKLVETRLLWKRDAKTWAAGTYVWDDAGTGATLYTGTKGQVRSDGYEIPTLKDCDKCHHGGSDHLLGVEAFDLALATAQGATLSALAADGWLSHPPARTSVALPIDATGKAGAALGYLHVNCGMACHSKRGIGDEAQLVMRLRAEEFWPTPDDPAPVAVDATTTDIWKATVNQQPFIGAVAQKYPGTFRVNPGSHETSLVWMLAHVRDKYQMPPLVSHQVDEAGTQALAEWIDAMSK